ncbi:MAG TPA: FAD-dependent oxidoreductase [Polyangiaceae bacterium]|nr:FAD-dependent oxidoreductase [Polyangiaceae bacterium]
MSPAAQIARTPVAILGAGLTGLSAALELERRGVEYRIFEKLAQPGGHAVTLEEQGFRFDRTGHLLHLKNDALRAEVLDWIGPDYLQIQRRSVIWSNGVYTRYPFQANTFGLPPTVAYDCVHGFLKAHFAKDKPQPTNFEEFCLQHFGEGISRHFMIPYNSRLWGVHPREITSSWCQRFVPLPRLEDVIAGAVGLNDRELGYNTNFIYPRMGIGQLAQGMARRVPKLELGKSPLRIELSRRRLRFEHEEVPFDVLLSSIPLPRLLELIDEVPEPIRRAAAKLRCSHLHYLDVALARPSGKDFHWAYVPEEKYPFYRVGCYSHFSPALAPPGKSSLYVELADRRPPNLERLLPQVADGLIEMGIIDRADEIEFARARRIDYAYVIFDHEYFAALDAIRPFLDASRIISSGRYGEWNYSAMEDAILFGRSAAERALEFQRSPA